jgi:hypothetical protein
MATVNWNFYVVHPAAVNIWTLSNNNVSIHLCRGVCEVMKHQKGITMKSNMKFFVLVMLCVVLACGVAAAQQNVQGEKWRFRVSMEMEGFSLPPTTMEVCVPADQSPDEAMMQQQNNNNECQITNIQRSGNKTTADIKCGGRDKMEGRFEIEMLGDTMRGTMTSRTADGTMTMKYEATKLGQACEVQTFTASKTQAAPKMPEMPAFDTCQILYDSAKNSSLDDQAMLFLSPQIDFMSGGKQTDCTKHEGFKNFCSAVQTPEGFSVLDLADQNGTRLQSGQQILPAALKACSLGSETALQSKLLPQAEKENRWSYLLRYGGNEYYTRLVEIAKKECSGRGFTNANPQYMSFCGNYGRALASNDRPGALAAAGCREEIPGRNVCIGYGVTGAKTQTAAEPEPAPAKAKSPAQKIRGLLGR